MIAINQNVIAEIKAEAEEFGFPATDATIARDYFNRMSYEDKAFIFAMIATKKNAAELSRACVAAVAELIAA